MWPLHRWSMPPMRSPFYHPHTQRSSRLALSTRLNRLRCIQNRRAGLTVSRLRIRPPLHLFGCCLTTPTQDLIESSTRGDRGFRHFLGSTAISEETHCFCVPASRLVCRFPSYIYLVILFIAIIKHRNFCGTPNYTQERCQ